jgi:organic radical activating enzyme
MKLTGLHCLLTYQCTLECDHCFVWGSPWQNGTMTLNDVQEILQQAKQLGTIRAIYFEGGEPFLYYATLLSSVREAKGLGFSVGVVSNAYWATSIKDAVVWLEPYAGLLDHLSVSSDVYHWNEKLSRQAQNASAAARKLGIPLGMIEIAQPEEADAAVRAGQLPIGQSAVLYRGRAADKLAARAEKHAWNEFTDCTQEDLREPGRVHVDPMGNLHICQGISIGNMFTTPLREICAKYDADTHPIAGALLAGGPAELIKRYSLPYKSKYADSCNLCYDARLALRSRFPEILVPDQMYGTA